MSRLDSKSPETSPALSRRAVLPGIVAAPTAVVAATGQAFSFPSLPRPLGVDTSALAAAIAADPRFAEFDRLASDIVDLELRQEEALEEYEDETIAWCNEEGENDGASPWVVLHNSLDDDMRAFAEANRHPPQDILDVILQAKIADYYFAVGDVGFDEVNAICPTSARHCLEFWGIKPLVSIEELRKCAPIHVALAESYEARELPTPLSVNAGSLIMRLRGLGKAYDAAIRREAGITDGTPESDAAIAVTDRRMAELEALRDEIIAGVNRPFGDLGPEDPYRLTQVHLFVVWMELISELRPDFVGDDAHGAVAPVLQQLRKEAASWTDEFVDHATRWNASHGGSNV